MEEGIKDGGGESGEVRVLYSYKLGKTTFRRKVMMGEEGCAFMHVCGAIAWLV